MSRFSGQRPDFYLASLLIPNKDLIERSKALVLQNIVFLIGPRLHGANEDLTKLRNFCIKWKLAAKDLFP